MVDSQQKRILIGSYYASGDISGIDIVNCPKIDARNIETILGKVVQKSVPVHQLGWEERDEYLVEWCEGPGWSNSRASIMGKRENYFDEQFSSFEAQAHFPGAEKFMEKILKQYEIRSPPPRNNRY